MDVVDKVSFVNKVSIGSCEYNNLWDIQMLIELLFQ